MYFEEFPLTAEGYQQAITWLREQNKITQDPVEHELASDGFTIINLVNHLRHRQHTTLQ